MTESPDGWLAGLERRAQLRHRAGLSRQLSPRSPNDALIDLAGNDYLGLSRHPLVRAAATKALDQYGLGSTGSRLVQGSTAVHAELEHALATGLGWAGCLVYSSGYLANLGVVRGLVRPRSLAVLDAHAHASLVDACRLAQVETTTAPHSNVDAIAKILAAQRGRRAVVITESVFSVDGDIAPLAELHAVCRRFGAVLLVDEAHAVGVLGPSGAGVVAALGLAGEPDIVVTATLSKALGGAGGAVLGAPALISHLVDTSRTFIYDTALPAPVAAGVNAALRLAQSESELRELVTTRARSSAQTLRTAGYVVGEPAAGVLSVRAPSAEAAVAWAQRCRAQGVAVGCFRPPSTPDSHARLRLTINAGVAAQDYEKALDIVVATAPRDVR